MSTHTGTPANLEITSRDLSFGRDAPGPRWWMNGDPVATAFYNALSASFPQGERFFMDSVRRFKDMADSDLKKQIVAFTTQEALHTREHLYFNKQITDHGYDLSRMDAHIKKRLDFGRTRDNLEQLGVTIALEHFTAILAHEVLSNPRHLADAPREAWRMWNWHAIEEVEHKAVAFDTFMLAAQSLPAWRRYVMRVTTMTITTVIFFEFLFFGVREFFKQDGINTMRNWLRLFGFMFGRPGLIRRVIGAWLTYFKPGFHPWNVDDRALVKQTEGRLSEAKPALAAG
jgi:predicted metal-dependent hydrolase